MSKISNRLAKLGQKERTGFGFGVQATNTKIPVILVGARINKPSEAKNTAADVYILAPGANGEAQSGPPAAGELWGVAVTGGTGDEIASAIKAGADFVVVEGDSAPGAALKDDDTGKGYVVPPGITEERAKAIDSGPFDFLILDGSNLKLPMNVGAALDVQQQIEAYSNHVFLQVTQVPEGQDLELLRDIGVSGLIYGSESAKELDLEELRKSIGLLEPR
ncbi:MAG: hypothetical protein O3B95_11570, partial [Chloroflexi bacterium]|nr:hypothetical protein [Chloroflexota bacterium]